MLENEKENMNPPLKEEEQFTGRLTGRGKPGTIFKMNQNLQAITNLSNFTTLVDRTPNEQDEELMIGTSKKSHASSDIKGPAPNMGLGSGLGVADPSRGAFGIEYTA